MKRKHMKQAENKYREIKITQVSEVINVSADALWQIVRKFEDVGQWFTSIDYVTVSGKSEFEGASYSERTCYVNLKGYSKVHEKLTFFDDSKRELAYELTEGAPGFLLFAGNHWTVSEVDSRHSVLKMEATLRLKKFVGSLLGGPMKKTVLKNLPIALNELKIFAETGEVSAAKKARMAELERKKRKKAA